MQGGDFQVIEDKKIAPVIVGLLLIIIGIGFAVFSLSVFSSENIDRMVLWIPIITIVSMFFIGGNILNNVFSPSEQIKENTTTEEKKEES